MLCVGTPQLASPQQGLLADALYSQFSSDHLKRIDRSCAVAIPLKTDPWFPSGEWADHLLPVEASGVPPE
jgi:hypothetical protein